MGKYFGTDGFRGEANVNLTAEHAYQIGRFLGWYYGELKKQKQLDEPAKIVIGKDTRRSSYMFEYSLVSGLTASGADAYLLHVTTTPSVAYVARTDDFDCGIMLEHGCIVMGIHVWEGIRHTMTMESSLSTAMERRWMRRQFSLSRTI